MSDYGEDDYMELGDTGYAPRGRGWLYDRESGVMKDSEGRIYDKEGDLIYDPNDIDEPWDTYDEDDYEWYDEPR